ncbi:hypothetical protein GUJ93_ZPchr0004g39262 [Zizania palustris]|uniref:ABC1 atypical kinase-like domain-containing protein n=1 Tax=Zizania palustris TaxID=103762 RepID=A0A8J5VZF3_ZIZPA|nr:hypothetical protein GUJ93_ZPchr0004g39262 [Zizania palustris]
MRLDVWRAPIGWEAESCEKRSLASVKHCRMEPSAQNQRRRTHSNQHALQDYTSSKVLTMEWIEGTKLNQQAAIEKQGKLVFLDFGMMSETPEVARVAIIGHVVHMVNRDYEAMARDYYALDLLEPDVDVSPIVPAIKNFFDDALNSTVQRGNRRNYQENGCMNGKFYMQGE